MSTTIYDVPGISCNHCKMAIEGEVGKLTDVDSVSVEVESKQVTVVGTASVEAVTSAIDEAGYEVSSSHSAD